MAFLIEYQRSTRKLLELRPFTDRALAFRALREVDARCRDNHDIEVVLLWAASETDLRRTHSRYFGQPELTLAN